MSWNGFRGYREEEVLRAEMLAMPSLRRGVLLYATSLLRRRIDLLICFMIYYRGYGGYTKPNPIWGSNARKKVSWLEARYTSTIPPWLGGGLGGGLWPPPCVVS